MIIIKKNNFFKKIFITIGLFVLFYSLPVHAISLLNPDTVKNMDAQDQAIGGEAGFADTTDASLGETVAGIIETFLSLMGIIFVILIIYAGFTWMTAGGEEAKVQKAKTLISRAIIGLVIIISAYAITYFVFNALGNATGAGGGNPVGGTP